MECNMKKNINTIEKNKTHLFNKAINLIKQNKKLKFKENIDTAICLNMNPIKKKMTLKGYSILPHNINRKYKIAVFISKDEELKNINTDTVIKEDNINLINKRKLNFDLIITTPKSILKMGKLNKILNSKGLAPDIKYGTITSDITKTITKLNKNYIKFKSDKHNIIHCVIGKIDLETKKLKENLEKLINDIKKQKPKSCTNIAIKSISISSTMGPGLKININSLTI